VKEEYKVNLDQKGLTNVFSGDIKTRKINNYWDENGGIKLELLLGGIRISQERAFGKEGVRMSHRE
jgi:hypothetical protein